MNAFQATAERLQAGRVVVLTGAGISTASGLPDFRSPQTGLWAGVDPMSVAHVDVLRDDPIHFWHFYRDRFCQMEAIQPNPAHHVLAEWQERGLVEAVITQNIDSLHTKTGSRTIELHGQGRTLRCQAGCAVEPLVTQIAELLDDDGVPRCPECGAIMAPNVVLFGGILPYKALLTAGELVSECQTLLAIGSSLVVEPVASLPGIALDNGACLIVINRDPTPYQHEATIVIHDDIVTTLQAIDHALANSLDHV